MERNAELFIDMWRLRKPTCCLRENTICLLILTFVVYPDASHSYDSTHYAAQNKENAKLFWSNDKAEKKEQVDELKHCRMRQYRNIMSKETTCL